MFSLLRKTVFGFFFQLVLLKHQVSSQFQNIQNIKLVQLCRYGCFAFTITWKKSWKTKIFLHEDTPWEPNVWSKIKRFLFRTNTFQHNSFLWAKIQWAKNTKKIAWAPNFSLRWQNTEFCTLFKLDHFLFEYHVFWTNPLFKGCSWERIVQFISCIAISEKISRKWK